jgi:hypothetical protein
MFADRGIGGTGIVGVITGFASICVDGLEVGIDPATPIRVEDGATSAASLRAGQLVIVTAHSADGMLRARDIAIRYEVSGPVQRVEDAGARLIVAGQPVTMPLGLRSGPGLRPAEWVSVSGFRTPAGDIAATRIDRREPGAVSLHGQVTASGGTVRIGRTALRLAPGSTAVPGQFVRVSGRLSGDVLDVDALSPDLLAADPPARFGPEVSRLVIQSYASVTEGRIRVGPGFEASVASDLAPMPSALGAPALSVVEFERGPGGSFVATGLRGLGAPGSSGAPFSGPSWTPFGPDSARGGAAPPDRGGFTPAPVPDFARMPPGAPGMPRDGDGPGGVGPASFGREGGADGVSPGFGCSAGGACRSGRPSFGPPPSR